MKLVASACVRERRRPARAVVLARSPQRGAARIARSGRILASRRVSARRYAYRLAIIVKRSPHRVLQAADTGHKLGHA